MKWFKHDSDAGNDAKLRKLRIKYGAQGYGIYWYCLELIARNVEKHNLTFELEHDAELIADDFKLNGEFVQEMMTFMVNLGLFENTAGVITCIKMSTRTDEYTQQLIREFKNTPEKLPIPSRETPDNIRGIRREEKRTDSNDVLDYLNKSANKNFKPVAQNLEFINARLKDFSKEDLIRVIDNKCAEWLRSPDYNKYLRPATLFNASKFAQYAGEVPMKKLSGVVL